MLGAALVALAERFVALRGADIDLFPRWYGLRALLVHGRDPYDAAVTAEIVAQTSFGAADEAVRAAYGFVYALPGALLLAPLAALPYEWAATVWLAMGAIALPLAAMAPAVTLGDARTGGATRLAVPLALLFVPAWWTLALVQPGLGVVALIGLALWRARRWPFVAGMALAGAALLKPQMAAPLAVGWMAYSAVRWRDTGARMLLAGAVAVTALLTAVAALLLPNWPTGFMTAVRLYGEVPGMQALTPALMHLWRAGGSVAIAALAAWALVGWWRDWGTGAGLPARGVARTLVVGALAVPPAWETNSLVLLVPLAGVLGRLHGRAAVGFVAASATISFALAPLPLVLPWRSGAVTAVAYALLWAAGDWWATRSAAKAAAAGRADPERPESL